ncbi:MAG: hypothetical protein PHE48_01235 [Candidatus Daviesbacteria bacterium]|nr:hypothetical protein [Candidatus Daviesbacteria bacterium]
MTIQQSKKQSDLEKRLQLLRRQVYGRELVASSKHYVVREEEIQKTTHTTNYHPPVGGPTTNSSTDLTYLHQDLLKILLFASCTIGAEVILFLLVKNNVLTLNFF